MKTLADLRAIKEKAKQDMAARDANAKYRIIVAMGTCGIAAGARNVMSAILDEVTKRNLTDTVISQSGCLGYCDQEPMVQVAQMGQGMITYGKVTPEVARQIVADHIQNNRPVTAQIFKQD